ncbi:LysR family transcriptional regulator [Paraburkholderia lycopersici]|uniref:DNA-binding transcriptional regulator, LysR family n=1 Tax=Paraburkholderia lycopersici TaxID=416944 RepID=A0A1G6GRY1_9BURK|nr:LysR family transcriptional regulator [Paraburkholderia lycopersici]SDB84750.1 DNA-binding transcriptional regulator, LysR family [Paraburkholderia lycopersici]
MNQLQAMRVFVSVAELGSFGRAATSLNMSNAVVTRYVALLEAHLETRLINRNTRTASLTEAGAAYAEGCRRLLDDLQRIETHIAQGVSVPSGTLRVVAHASFSLHDLTPMLKQYLAAFPKVRLSLTLLHRAVDLIEEGFDAGIVASRQVSGGTLIRRPLVSVAPVAVASPAYLARQAAPQRPADLVRHALLAPSADVHRNEWHFARPDGAREPVSIEPAYAVNNSAMLRQAAIAGMGITILPANEVDADLAKGSLLRVLAGWDIRDADKELSLVYPGRRHVPAKTRSFVDFTVEWFRERAMSCASASAITGTSCNS